MTTLHKEVPGDAEVMENNRTQKAALVTGATSGVGFEAAAQLAESGYARVTITGRSAARAETARAELVARTGREVFETLAVDLDRPKSVREAGEELARRGQKFDLLLLNAAWCREASSSEPMKASSAPTPR